MTFSAPPIAESATALRGGPLSARGRGRDPNAGWRQGVLAALRVSILAMAALGLEQQAAGQDLTEALDLPATVWSASGNEAWVGQQAETHDGVDAAKSGAVGDNQSSSIQATFQGPGALTYWRKISSEDGFDYLRVFVNDVEVSGAAITGEVEWQFHSVILGSGPNVVRWSYIKDEIIGEGADAAWLDAVSFIPPDQGAPFVARQPEGCGAELGSTVTLETGVFGQAPLQYQWRRNGIDVVGQTASILTLEGFGAAHTGTYDCVITNDLGSATTQPAAVSVVSLGPALDDVSRSWFAKGDGYWFAQADTTWDGVDALRSAPIGDDQACTFESVFEGPGTLTFRCKTSTEADEEGGLDVLRVRRDGAVVLELSDVHDWALYSISVPAGQHRVSWSYEKNARFYFGDDAVWIDQVRFSTSYGAWQTLYFSSAELNDSAVSGVRADPNGNGIENGWEYVLGNDPKAASGSGTSFVSGGWVYGATPGASPTYLAVRLVRPGALPADVTVEVQHAASPLPGAAWTTLATKTGNGSWVLGNGGVVDEMVLLGGQVETVVRGSTPVETGTVSGFMRARVTVGP